MNPTYNSTNRLFESARKLDVLRSDLRYWHNAPAWRTESEVAEESGLVRVLIRLARAYRRADYQAAMGEAK